MVGWCAGFFLGGRGGDPLRRCAHVEGIEGTPLSASDSDAPAHPTFSLCSSSPASLSLSLTVEVEGVGKALHKLELHDKARALVHPREGLGRRRRRRRRARGGAGGAPFCLCFFGEEEGEKKKLKCGEAPAQGAAIAIGVRKHTRRSQKMNPHTPGGLQRYLRVQLHALVAKVARARSF